MVVRGVVLASWFVVLLACGGGGSVPEGPVTPPPAPAHVALEFTKWRCDNSTVEFLSGGRCVDRVDESWGCTWTQTGNDVRLQWTPGPNTSAGNAPQRWEMRLVDEITMGGLIHTPERQIDWRCTLDFRDYLR